MVIVPPYSTLMALTGQAFMHCPQRTQMSSLIRWGFLISPVMAETGQARAHFVHPMHFAGSIV
jgi:hypothetical protein